MNISYYPLGLRVVVLGSEHEGARTIVEHMNQFRFPGGVVLDHRVSGLRYWNIDELREATEAEGAAPGHRIPVYSPEVDMCGPHGRSGFSR